MLPVKPSERSEALHDADDLWDYGEALDDYRRTMTAKAISYLGVFSLDQLAQIARVTVKDLQKAKAVEYDGKAGRLNPESLKTLRLFYATWYTKGKVSQPLLSLLLKDGTDLQAVTQTTGIPLEELK